MNLQRHLIETSESVHVSWSGKLPPIVYIEDPCLNIMNKCLFPERMSGLFLVIDPNVVYSF